jgi:hypothetical protein
MQELLLPYCDHEEKQLEKETDTKKAELKEALKYRARALGVGSSGRGPA